jgi:hypothetical protein
MHLLCSVEVTADETWTLSLSLLPAVRCMLIRFIHAEGRSAVEIHRRLCCVYGDNVMSDMCERIVHKIQGCAH